MKTTIAIGDIHGSDKWKDIVHKSEDATIIFMGDYLDPYDRDYDPEAVLKNFSEIIDFRNENPDRVVLLLGNHDLHYYSHIAKRCSRYNAKIAPRANALFTMNRNAFQNAYQTCNIIFTHAGISQQWFMDDFKGNINGNIADQLNNPSADQIDALLRAGAARGGQEGTVGGPFWADHSELKDPLHGYTQVAGHNRVKYIAEFQGQHQNKIIFCDCLPFGGYYSSQEQGNQVPREKDISSLKIRKCQLAAVIANDSGPS